MIGEKDSDGNPTKVDRFRVVEPDGNSTYTELDENNTLTSARHSSGMKMNFDWNENSTEVHLDIVIPGTSQQVSINIILLRNDTNSTEIDEFDQLAYEEESIEKRDIKDKYKIIHNKRKRSNEIEKKEENEAYSALKSKRDRTKRNTQPSNTARVSISVESCGSADNDATVQADVTQDDTTYQYSGELSTTPGLYYVYIPTKTSVAEVTEDVCDAVEMALDTACSWYDKANKFVQLFSKHSLEKILCFYLGKGLQLIPQLKFLPIYKFCKLIFKGIDYYCNKINSPIVEGVIETKKSELICDLITEVTDTAIDPLFNTNIYLVPIAIFLNGQTVTGMGQQLNLQPGTSQVSTTFTISDGSFLQITSLFITPPDPDPLQDYTATVEYKCFSLLTTVSMTIVGTDGYSGSTSCTGGPSCILYVPGAVALVVDTVTVSISDSSTNQYASREATIIF